MMKEEKRTALLVILVLVISALGIFTLGWKVRDREADQDEARLLSRLEVVHEEIEVSKNRRRSLEKLLDEGEERVQVLLDQLALLGERPSWVIRADATMSAATPEVIELSEPPPLYLHYLENGAVVGRFAYDGQYHFETYDLSLAGDLAISEDRSALSLRVASSYQPDDWYEVPVDLEVYRTSEQARIFEPHLGLGVTSSIPGGMGGSVWTSFIHLDAFDLGAVRLTLDDVPRIGLDPVLYNLGSDLPVLTNTWIGAGPSLGADGNWSGSLTIGVKF